MTKKEKVKRSKKIFKKIFEEFKKEEKKKCLHGVSFLGANCFICHPDEIASAIRNNWYPTPTYKANVYIKNESGDEDRLELDIKTHNPTKKIMEMQNNGFWYLFKNKPVFMTPNSIKVVQLDDRLQSRGYTDPADSPDLIDFGISQSFQR